jgi:hypothetical protein
MGIIMYGYEKKGKMHGWGVIGQGLQAGEIRPSALAGVQAEAGQTGRNWPDL